ncbi:hypothetical protein LPB87_02885 [Flavobacterium sp. EDS]|uniref:hypothetical protein n=1 Tax=Flavobacterium sp. EDS TaxID=2897328 RepID=UPI001E5D04A2|nr:hypothetical protein [Flavobacterium sp. EDS]MCD0473333.1 hypothetical protein [Flavobacterium sp. EDS]
MKKSKLIIGVLFIIVSSCKVVNNDYLIIHSNDKDVYIRHYFHKNNNEYARVYGNNKENDSITFLKDNNDLLVNEFIYSPEQKKHIAGGNIRYVNYYTSVTDIKYSEKATFSINIIPIKNLDFLKNDTEIENITKESCKTSKNNDNKYSYSNCNFILPQSNNLDYLPNNSKIISIEIIKNKEKQLQEINANAEYFDKKIYYKRIYYYQDKRILRIKTLVRDSISTDTSLDSYSKISLK